MQRNMIRKGWRPSLPDFRDKKYKDCHSPAVVGAIVSPDHIVDHDATAVVAQTGVGADGLPLTVSLRSKMPPVWDQGQLGACSAHAASALFTFVHGGGPWSRLALYYNERAIEGTIDTDAGACMRDSIMVLANTGIGLEKDWDYDTSKFAVAPPAVEVGEESSNKATEYSKLESREDFRQCLAQGFPFIFGATLYSSFETDDVAASGMVPLPTRDDSVVGGHALCCVGYAVIDGKEYYEIRNSWNSDWGLNGYCYMPAEYMENPDLVSDVWTIRKA